MQKSSYDEFPYGLTVRIPGFHPGGPGWTPGMRKQVVFFTAIFDNNDNNNEIIIIIIMAIMTLIMIMIIINH